MNDESLRNKEILRIQVEAGLYFLSSIDFEVYCDLWACQWLSETTPFTYNTRLDRFKHGPYISKWWRPQSHSANELDRDDPLSNLNWNSLFILFDRDSGIIGTIFYMPNNTQKDIFWKICNSNWSKIKKTLFLFWGQISNHLYVCTYDMSKR